MAEADPVDVLIVGAGAAGAAFAWSLAGTRMDILCLEQGDWMNPADYPTAGMDWEIRGQGDFALSPNVRKRPADYPVDDAASPIKISNFNAVGGSTVLYAGHFPRMKPSDFRVRSLDGVADDWPIDYATLAPYWAENDRMMGVAGLAGDPAYPPKEVPLPPVPLGRVGETLARGFNQLGWHWWPSDSAIATRAHEGRAPCINLGPCITGCAQGAKGSTDVTYWPAAIRKGVRLRTRCRVSEILVRPDGMADGVVYFDADGVERRQRAEIVVLACNGVGTPRLLLNSRSPRFPDGLANRSGLVGRNLMFHPYAMVLGVFGETLDGSRGPTGCGLWSHEFYETDRARDFVRGFSFELMRGFGPMATALWGLSTGQMPWGEGHHRAHAELLDRTAGLLAICEDLPEPHNRVTLSPELTDTHGIPAPRIEYRLSENSQRMLDYGATRAREVLMAAGAKRTYVDSPLALAGWHLMGTARMGRDPARSVVNDWGRAHDVRNLFVVDGSVFVTAGAVNPTCTIQGIALYVADRIQKNLGNLFD
jgi:choline dehydrogenase-like flavoprotein